MGKHAICGKVMESHVKMKSTSAQMKIRSVTHSVRFLARQIVWHNANHRETVENVFDYF